jgi:hypothetical protein
VEEEFRADRVGILVKVIDPVRVEGRGTANQSMDFITLPEQEFR